MAAPFLESIVAEYDRAGVRGLAPLAQPPLAPSQIDALLKGVGDPRTSVAATWVLRAALAAGQELDRSQTAALLRELTRIREDDARLHVCQSVVHLEVPSRSAAPLARFLRERLAGEHKFTRAWALDALVRLAQQHDGYRREALDALARAGTDPAASVRARARRLASELSF